jgi:hypothetical protein
MTMVPVAKEAFLLSRRPQSPRSLAGTPDRRPSRTSAAIHHSSFPGGNPMHGVIASRGSAPCRLGLQALATLAIEAEYALQ